MWIFCGHFANSRRIGRKLCGNNLRIKTGSVEKKIETVEKKVEIPELKEKRKAAEIGSPFGIAEEFDLDRHRSGSQFGGPSGINADELAFSALVFELYYSLYQRK